MQESINSILAQSSQETNLNAIQLSAFKGNTLDKTIIKKNVEPGTPRPKPKNKQIFKSLFKAIVPKDFEETKAKEEK